jgi:hypothetical protein
MHSDRNCSTAEKNGKFCLRLKMYGDRCYDFLNIFAEKFREKMGVFDSKQS